MPPPAASPASDAGEIAEFLASAGVGPGARVLDAPCGIGRRARDLAERGYHVTAVDANAVAIETLRRRVPKRLAGKIEYRASAAEGMPGGAAGETYDAVLCLDHALGRETPAKDVALLVRLRDRVGPQGLLVVDILHRDFFAARPRPFAYHVVGEIEQHEFRAFDSLSGVLGLTWKFYQRDGNDLRFRGISSMKLRLLAPDEAEGLLRAAGWTTEAWYGGWGKEAVSADRRKLLLVARPAARS